MKLTITLAWRNIWRNRRRTLLTITAIFFATLLTVVTRGLSEGTWIYNVRNTVELFSGYIQLQRHGYQESPSLHKYFFYTQDIEQILRSTPAVTGFAPRILTEGLVCYKDKSSGSMLFGIDPDKEQKVSRLTGRLKNGHLFSANSHDEVVIGEKMFQNLDAKIGDSIVILTQAFDGTLGNMRYRIAGTIKLGIPELDESSIYMSLTAAQELLAMDRMVHMVAISVSSLEDIENVKENISVSIEKDSLTNISVLTWEEVMPELKQAMEFDRIGDQIFLAILIIIVTFGILNTFLMSVTERFREFGVTLAIGMKNISLMLIVLTETLMITIAGLAVGCLGGYLLNLYFHHNPIMLTGEFAQIYADYGFLPLIIATNSAKILVAIAFLILVISFSASLYPVYKVSKLEPLKGIRYT